MSTIPRPGTEVVARPWQSGLAPVYIGMFLWVAFFDQLGRRALPLGGVGASVLGAAVAGLLGYLFLFRASANWGHRSGQPLKVVATSTFGVRGASMVPGLLIGIAQMALFAVAVGYAVELTFQGLVLLRLVDSQALRPSLMGGSILKSPVYLGTALFWAVATALVSLKFIRWIAYLMQFFPIFPALLIGLAMMKTMLGLRYFHPTSVDPINLGVNVPKDQASLQAFLLTLQWVFGFSAMAGVMGADWGAGSVTSKDVRAGGWIGMAFAPAIISALALLAVAGFQGSREASRMQEDIPFSRPKITELPTSGQDLATGSSTGLDIPAYSFRAVLNGQFDPRVGGLMLLVFGLASLAPAVYSSFMFGEQFKTLGPGISRLTWTMLGTCTAWLMIVGGWFERTEVAFNLLGACFAPIAGAMTADYRRHKGSWPGSRVGTNPPGLIAWGVGLAVGLLPTIGRSLGSPRLVQIQPAAVWAFVAAYLVYEILAALRLESAQAPKPVVVIEP